MKLSDYVAQKVYELGVRQVFMITGGGSMHLNQSVGTYPGLSVLFNHHEQACAMAAESYFRLTNRPALVNVTSGPGATNAITGVHGAWTDSLGMLVISGQVKLPTTVKRSGLNLRQLGDQEVDIVTMISSITKYSVMIDDPDSIRFHLEKAYYLAAEGRPGPCWIDIPIDIQSADIDHDKLEGFTPPCDAKNAAIPEDLLRQLIERIEKARSPLIFAGSGIRISGAHKKFLQLIDKLKIPVVTGWNAHDVLCNDHPLFVGRPGTVGDRAGNFAVQNADFLLILGSRLNIRQVSYNWESFAKKAFKVWVDVDPVELKKPTVQPDIPIVADLNLFISQLSQLDFKESKSHIMWLEWCRERTQKYPVVRIDYWKNKKVNPYCFMEALFSVASENEVVVAGNGTACVVAFQAAKLKSGQRMWTNSGSASMGYDLPAAIGACMGRQGKQIVCLAGDGSIMMNLQELQTIIGNNLPIKIFILNNSGYVSIKQTHQNFFNGREVGAGESSGVNFPSFRSLSAAFGFQYKVIKNHKKIDLEIKDVLEKSGAVICEVFLDPQHVFAPKLSSRQLQDGTMLSPTLEDMAPHLPTDELNHNIYI